MSGRATVFVIDDDESVLKALSRLIRSVGFEVETFPSAGDFLNQRLPDCPSCAVLDVRMPGLSGFDLQEKLKQVGVEIPIIFITGHGDVPMSVRAMKAGAVDFLQKPFNDQELLDAIQRAVSFDQQERRERTEKAEIQDRIDSLTPREKQVLALVVTGMLNKQIGAELGATEKTIKVHRARVMEKMQAASLPDLVRIAEKVGIHGSKPISD